jgi:hypothetical protein
VNAEFNWWLLIVGLVIGAALTWLVMAESTRRDADLTDSEQRGEALWIASMLSPSGEPTDPARVEQVLRLHREYLAAPPPDDPVYEPDVGVDEEPDVAQDAVVTTDPLEPDLATLPKADPAIDVLSTPPEDRP